MNIRQITSLFFVCCITITTPAHSQEKKHTVILELDGEQYDTLGAYGYCLDGNRYDVWGKSMNNNSWSFTIPDSIYHTISKIGITLPQYNDTRHFIAFKTKVQSDTTTVMLVLDRGDTTILHARHIYTTPHSGLFRNTDGKVIMSQHFTHWFFVDYKNLVGKETGILAQSPKYSTFSDRSKELTYEQFLDEYILLAKKYPASKYLIHSIANSLTNYKKRKDLEVLFSSFSKETQESLAGLEIQEFLTNNLFQGDLKPFTNMLLTSAKSGKPERILQDTGRYSLVVFSASWCGYCHAQIPLLKEVYNDLKDRNFSLTYVSTDKEKDIDRWLKVLDKEAIPWRSVVAGAKAKEVEDTFAIEGIPYAVLVHPNGIMERLDVRKKDDKEKLYNLLGKL